MQIIWKLAETWVTLSRFRWNNTNKFAMLCINLRNHFHQKQYIEQETNIWWCNNDTKTAVVSACQVAWEVWRLDPGRTNLQEIYGTMWKMCCSCLGFSKLGSMQEFPQNSSLIPMKLHMMVLNCFRYLGFQQWQCGSSNKHYIPSFWEMFLSISGVNWNISICTSRSFWVPCACWWFTEFTFQVSGGFSGPFRRPFSFSFHVNRSNFEEICSFQFNFSEIVFLDN